MRTSRLAQTIIARIEGADALDRLGELLNTALGRLIPSGPVEDVLSGTPIGHPLHPAVVSVPIGAWTSSLVLDAQGRTGAARTLIGVGLVGVAPAAASGASDWLTLQGAERRVGLVHALLNYAGIAAFGASWLVRGRGHHAAGVGLSVAGTAAVGVAGWLGGHLTYAQGVGVDTTVFEALPKVWTDLGPVDDLPADGRLGRRDLGGVPVLVTRAGERVVVMADRCTHRGAPLHEGSLDDGCVVCPWHESRFDLADGSVVSGPATRPQPTLETRVADGRVLVRRLDPRTAATRAVGP